MTIIMDKELIVNILIEKYIACSKIINNVVKCGKMW
jgi:hypothetical protein